MYIYIYIIFKNIKIMSEINTTENIDVDKESLSTIEKEN
jgi:hypothetical protein